MSLLEERGRTFDFGAHVTAVAFPGGLAAFALGDGTVRLVGAEGEESVAAHDGACLAMTATREGVVTAGDDGRLVRITQTGTLETLAETGGRWIDHVCAGPNGMLAYTSGRTARFLGRQAGEHAAPSSIGGLAFAPKGIRLALAHYDGVTLWYPGMRGGTPARLDWKGAHRGVAFSPDGRFLVTTMQENAMHGWRLADGQHLRMTGYPARVRGISWSAKGRFLATTGAEALILWPFDGKAGPMGRAPKELGVRPHLTTATACHPATDVVAAGYADGMVMLIRMEDGAEIVLAEPGGGPVTSIAWDAKGEIVAFGTDEGRAGFVPL